MIYKEELHNDFIDYLLRIFENENKRLDVIESKISQLIAQSGIIISIFSFIIPFMYDKLSNENCLFKVAIVLLFFTTLLLFGISIHNASKVYKVSDFKYMDCSPETVDEKFDSENDFKNEYINDLKNSIKNNKKTNNKKASKLITANLYFKLGVYSLILLSLILVINFLL